MVRGTLAAAVSAIALLFAGGAAHAACSSVTGDVTWNVSGTFSDGGTVGGCFYTDVYGYLDTSAPWVLTTTTGTQLTGFTYDTSDSNISSGTNFIDVEPGYQQDLHLEFADPLTVPSSSNPINVATSYECDNSFVCYEQEGATTPYTAPPSTDYRYLETPATGPGPGASSSAPEPTAWALMLAGVSMVGAGLRRRRLPAAA